MKNLKINNEWFKKTISAGLVLVTLSNLAGCSLNKDASNSTDIDDASLENVVANNKIMAISDLCLKDLETNTIIGMDTVEAILVDDKLDRNFDLIRIIYDSSVESILVNNELIPVSRLGLYNVALSLDVDSLDYAVSGDVLIPIAEYVSEIGITVEDDEKEEESEDKDEYVELTDEKFYELVDKVYEEYTKIGLDVTKEEVTDYIMFVNIDKITTDNKELVATIIGDRKIENVELNAFDVYSAVMTKNNENYCAKGLGWDSIILVSPTVFDKQEKEAVLKIEERIKEVFESSEDKEEFNKLLNDLLMEMLNATEEEFNMGYGVGYSTMTILVNFVRRNFTSMLDEANAELIKYFISYAEEYGTSYYDNSRSTAYYSGIYNLVTDNLSCAKTKTK